MHLDKPTNSFSPLNAGWDSAKHRPSNMLDHARIRLYIAPLNAARTAQRAIPTYDVPVSGNAYLQTLSAALEKWHRHCLCDCTENPIR